MGITNCASPVAQKPPNFSVSLDPAVADTLQEGRLLILLSTDSSAEPRFQISTNLNTQLGFGQDVVEWAPGKSMDMKATAFGYPIEHLVDIPPGEYYVQAFLNRYESFRLSTGHTVSLPPEMGEGQHWNRKPGNLYSTPQKIRLSGNGGTFNLTLDQVTPPIEEPEDSEFVRHIKMRSELLSEFWGQDIYLGAHVLVPKDFDEHPEAKYPLMIFHGHFPYDFSGFRTEPPQKDLEPDYSARFKVSGYNKIQQQEAYDFYQKWVSDDFPRVLIIEIQHANPYYDDSYAVNSANIGPYGDAITYELIPYIEQQFQGIGEPWSRFLYGGSTGGWEALAAQVFYPDEYNGCFAACPDPIDFEAYTLVNIYEDRNAYYYESDFKQTPRPGMRDYLGHISCTLEEMNHLELMLGDKSRSGQQWDIWEAVYSPQGADGYPKRLWDKYTGEIDPEVALYWKENYDLRYILEREWATLGPKLEGKIHIYCGDMDNYYLNNAVYLMEAFLEGTTDPYYGGEIDYGDRAEHCWNGDQENPNHISRLRYNTMYLPKILSRIKKAAPNGADLSSWRY